MLWERQRHGGMIYLIYVTVMRTWSGDVGMRDPYLVSTWGSSTANERLHDTPTTPHMRKVKDDVH